MEKHIDYGPKDPNWHQINSLIQKLSESNKNYPYENLLELGDFLNQDNLISNKQQENLIHALEDSRILKYRRIFILASDKDKVNGDEQDMAGFNLDANCKLQILTIKSFSRINKISKISDLMGEIVSLFNQAHINTTHNVFDYNNPIFLKSVEEFSSYEKLVFQTKNQNGLFLLENKLINHLDFESILELKNISDFRYNQNYDQLIILNSFQKILESTDLKKRFQELQKVLKLGAKMAYRDSLDEEIKWVEDWKANYSRVDLD
jgi:hypothetical protein